MKLFNGRALWIPVALVAVISGAGCPGGGGPDGGLPPDPCNSLDQALNDSQCSIPENATDFQDHISFANDQDWFSFTTPATLDARSLLRVTGGYGASATPVQLSINLLRQDGTVSLGRVVDQHGQGAPQPLQILTRFTEPNTRLVLLAADQPDSPARPQFDAVNPYLLSWTVLEDPDTNEPNDTTPTPIPLSGSPLAGSGTGILATQDDQDLFSINVPAAGKILYFHVGEATPAPKPVLYRLAYTLLSPAGVQVAEGRVDTVFDTVNLATARKVAAAGNYTLSIHAYREPGVIGPLPGDDRLTYKIDVLIVDEQDANEPNNDITAADAQAVSLTLGSTRTFTGRIGYVGDPDWYAVDVPSNTTSAQILHYKVLPPTGTGRFPPLPVGPAGYDRQVTVVTAVTQGTTACQTDATLCPKGYAGNPLYQPAVEQICARTPAQCLWSDREEDPSYGNLKNFEGKIPITPHSTPTRYYVVVQDVGNDWADDRDYTLQVTLEADADDTTRLSLPNQTQVVSSFAEDLSGSTFPAPPASASTLSGKLSFGYGRLINNDPTVGQGIRGPADYDAVETDTDRYELDFPAGQSVPLDRTWELQWTVQNVNGVKPEDLFVDVTFCDGTVTPTDGGTCTPVSTSRSGGGLVFAYDSTSLKSWWNVNQGISLQPLWDLATTSTSETVTARAYGCFCFEPRFVQGGKFFLRVGGVDRNTWDEASYTVKTAFTAYPKSFSALADGGFKSCPAVVMTIPDAGTPDPDAGTDGGTFDAGGPVYSGGCDFTR